MVKTQWAGTRRRLPAGQLPREPVAQEPPSPDAQQAQAATRQERWLHAAAGTRRREVVRLVTDHHRRLRQASVLVALEVLVVLASVPRGLQLAPELPLQPALRCVRVVPVQAQAEVPKERGAPPQLVPSAVVQSLPKPIDPMGQR